LKKLGQGIYKYSRNFSGSSIRKFGFLRSLLLVFLVLVFNLLSSNGFAQVQRVLVVKGEASPNPIKMTCSFSASGVDVHKIPIRGGNGLSGNMVRVTSLMDLGYAKRTVVSDGITYAILERRVKALVKMGIDLKLKVNANPYGLSVQVFHSQILPPIKKTVPADDSHFSMETRREIGTRIEARSNRGLNEMRVAINTIGNFRVRFSPEQTEQIKKEASGQIEDGVTVDYCKKSRTLKVRALWSRQVNKSLGAP